MFSVRSSFRTLRGRRRRCRSAAAVYPKPLRHRCLERSPSARTPVNCAPAIYNRAHFRGEFREGVKAMGIQEVLWAPRSPWQRTYMERMNGTIRRECLDHVIVLNEASLYRHVKSFLAYYHESRTHLSLAKDTPEPRPVQPLELGAVVAIPQVGGLHHRYERRAA